jgi:hypothetical protein
MCDGRESDPHGNAGLLVTERVGVEVRRSGGITGRTVAFAADSSMLNNDDARRLEAIISETGVDEPNASQPAKGTTGRGADRFHYTVTVKTSSSERSYSFSEGSAEYERFSDLIAFILEIARSDGGSEREDR